MFVSHDAFSKCGYRWAWILSLSASIGTFGQLKAFDVGWRKPLSTKEREIEANILQRHNILGLYPSMVEVPIDGSSVDITTSAPFSDAVHAVAWTSHYLAGASYRYAWLRDGIDIGVEIAHAHFVIIEEFSEVLCHALGEGGHQYPIAGCYGRMNLSEQVIHLGTGWPHFHNRVYQTRRTHYLLYRLTRVLAFVSTGRSRDINCLRTERLPLLELEGSVIERRR